MTQHERKGCFSDTLTDALVALQSAWKFKYKMLCLPELFLDFNAIWDGINNNATVQHIFIHVFQFHWLQVTGNTGKVLEGSAW